MATVPGIYLIVLPEYTEEGFIHWISLALKNHLPVTLDYKFSLKQKGEVVYACHGTLEPTDIIDLEDLPFAELNESPELWVSYQLKDEEGNRVKGDKTLRIKPKHLAKGAQYCDLVQEQAFVYEVYQPKGMKPEAENIPAPKPFTVDPQKLKEAMLQGGNTRNNVVHVTEARDEVDLHLEALVEDTRGMSDSEKLQLQLDTFDQVLESAIANNLHYLVVIHGIGKGKLKKEVHQRLAAHPMVHKYNVTNDRRYGEGATEIFL